MVIWKFNILGPSWSGSLSIPFGSKFVHFDFQHKNPTLWFLVDPSAPIKEMYFEVVGTGQEVPGNSLHVASTQQVKEGKYWVWHLFEVQK